MNARHAGSGVFAISAYIRVKARTVNIVQIHQAHPNTEKG